MDEQSFQKKERLSESSRLSESYPKFKPVLVKKLLADESDDDDSDDEQACNSDNLDDDMDDFDGFQPLQDECTDNSTSKVLKTDDKIETKEETAAEANDKFVKNIEILETQNIKESDRKSLLNSYLKDSLRISEFVTKKDEDDKGSTDKPLSGAKRKSIRESLITQSQWQSNTATILDKRKSVTLESKSYSPEIKRHSQSVTNQTSDVKERVQQFESFSQDPMRYSSSSIKPSSVLDDKSKIQADPVAFNKAPTSLSLSSTIHGVTDTPMKLPHGSSRPNPSTSHRNIFQTPQNKMSSESQAKNNLQTPATIFSHWLPQHMAQTPMHSQVSTSKESLQTPATSSIQSQSSRHETPRYFTGENKSVRRPLADSMFSASVHGPLPKLQEVASPLISKDNNSIPQEIEKKPVYSTPLTTLETKENSNPNPADMKIENYANNQPKLSVLEKKHVVQSQDNNPKIEYQKNTYNTMPAPRPVDKYENYHPRESQPIHKPAKTKPEQMVKQHSIPSQRSNASDSRNSRIIIVENSQYIVLGVIGQGMSCEVVRAQNLSNNELRAIKCVNLGKMDKDSVQGCLQEICMLDKLRAPCIVNMYHFEIKQNWLHVVMEIGDTDLSRLLKSMLQEKKKIPLTMILYYWTEMLTAVKHIHDNGVIHSDLKPANFLLVRGRLKLIDFGIASSMNADMTSVVKNCTIGTLNYISPEALMDVNAGSSDSPNHNVKYKISYKSDVWSLGCMLYGLVYGVTPFNHIRQQWAKVSAITDPKHKINFPLTAGSDRVPTILIDVMRRCLQRDVKARPSVAELLEIPYLQNNIGHTITPNIPSNILRKIKQALSDEEWKQFTESLDNK